MFDWLKKLTGDSTLRTLGAIEPAVEEINRLGEGVGALPDQEIRARSLALRDQVQDAPEVVDARQALEEKRADLEAETDPDRRIVLRDEWKRARRAVFEAEQHVLADVLPEAFALVREAARRTIGQVHFDSQLRGGIVLHQGKIAEMKTGEGKTLTATLPLYLNALAGHGAHLVTVNDYLARRDCGWMGEVFYFLGLSTGVVIPDFSGIYDPGYINEDVQGHDERLMHLRPCSRHEAYLADISYGTNNEFGFDYLRDNMAHDLADVVQRELYYAIVDEVDNILVDEARTPLIISAPDEESYKQYVRFARVANGLGAGDYEIEEKERLVTLTDQGVDRVEKQLGIDPERGQSLYDADHAELTYFLDAALKARFLYRKDTDYVVREGLVVIVDEFTGRMMPGRRWSDGIHESIEAKEQQIYREKVEIQRESKTYATITLQNYFRLYQKVAGMSGTAATEQEEFFKIYGLEVVTIPTYKPMIRDDAPDRIYAREEAKLRAVVRDILHNYCLGRPVLVGTTSVATSERLAGYLDRKYVALAVWMPLVARALRAADLGGETQRTLREIFGEQLERFGVPFQSLARAALLAPGTLREELFTRAADQVERLIEAQEGRERSQRAANSQEDEEGNRERARERKKQRGGEQKAIRQALQEATQGAFDQVVTMLDLQAAEEVERLRKALDEGMPEAQVLNAKQHEREALVIAKAGQKYAVTIATNMAGRGVDIILGGDPTQRAYERLEPFLLDKDRHVQRAVDALLSSPNAESSLPRVRGFLPAPLAERSTAVDGDGYLHDLARWMWQEVEGAQGLKEQLKEVPLPHLLQQRIGPRYPDVEPQPLGELVTLIDKSVRRRPFERHELREWAAEHNLGHLVDEAVGRVRRVFRTEHYVSAFRLQTELATLYGLEPGLAKDFADAILREGQVPGRHYIFRWAQDGGIPRYVVEGAWQEYDYLASVGSPDRLRDMVAGRLYTSYMNGLTALLRAVLGGNQTRGQEVIAATPALPAFFVEEVARVRQECEQDREGIRALGGLRITGTERHEARRIDNQLRGRSGRLGDPGYSQFYVSTEDELMRRFGPGADRMRTTIERFNLDEETVIEARVLSGMIEQAQVKVEGFHFDIRKHLVEYDDVLNRQRDVIYAERRRILDADDVHAVVLARLREEVADRAEETFAPLRAKREYDRDREAVLEALSGLLEEIQAGRHSRESARMPLFPIVVHIIAEGLRQDPAMQVLARLQELNGKLRQGEVQAEEAQAALAEMATLARQGGAEEAAAELERVGAEDTAAHVGAQLATWREMAESVLRAGLQEIIEAMLLQNQQRFEESVSQAVARFLEEGEGDERGLHLTRLYRGLTKEWGIYLPPSVSTARWMGMAPAEIEAEVLEAVRNQAVDNLPRSRQRLLEQISRVVRDWSAGQSDWLVVEKFLGEHRLPAHLAAEPLLDLLDGDINAFQDAIVDELHALAQSFLDDRGQRLGAELLNQIEQRYLLEAMDREWIDYLTAMEELRQGIGLRAYGQQDPLVEYRRESFHLFERLMQRVRERALFYIYASAQVPVQQHASTAQAREDRRVEGAKQAAAEGAGQPVPGTPGAARAPGGGKKHRKRKRK